MTNNNPANKGPLTEQDIDKLYNKLGLDRANYGESNPLNQSFSFQEHGPKISGNSYFGVRTSNSSDFSKGPHSKKDK